MTDITIDSLMRQTQPMFRKQVVDRVFPDHGDSCLACRMLTIRATERNDAESVTPQVGEAGP